MRVLQPIGRVFIAFLATSGRLILFTLSTNPMKYLVIDDNLHPSGKVYTP